MFSRKDLGGSHESENALIFSPKNGTNKVSPICLKMVEKGLKCMEPRAQNAHLLPFLYYDTIMLTKNDFLPVLYSNVRKRPKFLQSLRGLHCWIANRLEYTNP